MIYDIWYMIYDIHYGIRMIHCIFSYLYIDIWFLYNTRNVRILWHFSLDDLYFLANRSGAVEVRSPGGRSAADEGRIGSRAAGSPAGHGEGVVCKRKKTVDFLSQRISHGKNRKKSHVAEHCGFPVRPKLLWIAWTRPNCTKSPPAKNTRITVKLKMLKMLKGLKAVSQSTSCLD